MYIMTLKMKFIQDPRLEFFEKKSSRFIIVIIYINTPLNLQLIRWKQTR